MRKKKDIFDRIMELPGLRILNPFYQRYREVLLYLFFGGLTTFVSIASFWLFCRLGWDPLVANAGSWVLAVLFAYITNSIWVFESRPQDMQARVKQIIGFFGGRVSTFLMEEAVLLAGIRGLHLNEMDVKVAAQILVLVGNYVISKFLVFRK